MSYAFPPRYEPDRPQRRPFHWRRSGATSLAGRSRCYTSSMPGVPVLATLHLPLDWYAPEVFRCSRARTYLNCVSTAQRRACALGATLLPPISNGVPVRALAARHAKRRFALALGRICPEKDLHLALEAARRAGTAFDHTAH